MKIEDTMKPLSEGAGIEKLSQIREGFRQEIAAEFEHRAMPCSICTTPGACCLDEHFVNVRISRLEASAIRRAVDELDFETRSAVFVRLERIKPGAEFYSCPLYETRVGCLVHHTAKPLPCIAHACYAQSEDLPPDELLETREIEIDLLNRRVYRRGQPLEPIHAALR